MPLIRRLVGWDPMPRHRYWSSSLTIRPLVATLSTYFTLVADPAAKTPMDRNGYLSSMVLLYYMALRGSSIGYLNEFVQRLRGVGVAAVTSATPPLISAQENRCTATRPLWMAIVLHIRRLANGVVTSQHDFKQSERPSRAPASQLTPATCLRLLSVLLESINAERDVLRPIQNNGVTDVADRDLAAWYVVVHILGPLLERHRHDVSPIVARHVIFNALAPMLGAVVAHASGWFHLPNGTSKENVESMLSKKDHFATNAAAVDVSQWSCVVRSQDWDLFFSAMNSTSASAAVANAQLTSRRRFLVDAFQTITTALRDVANDDNASALETPKKVPLSEGPQKSGQQLVTNHSRLDLCVAYFVIRALAVTEKGATSSAASSDEQTALRVVRNETWITSHGTTNDAVDVVASTLQELPNEFDESCLLLPPTSGGSLRCDDHLHCPLLQWLPAFLQAVVCDIRIRVMCLAAADREAGVADGNVNTTALEFVALDSLVLQRNLDMFRHTVEVPDVTNREGNENIRSRCVSVPAMDRPQFANVVTPFPVVICSIRRLAMGISPAARPGDAIALLNDVAEYLHWCCLYLGSVSPDALWTTCEGVVLQPSAERPPQTPPRRPPVHLLTWCAPFDDSRGTAVCGPLLEEAADGLRDWLDSVVATLLSDNAPSPQHHTDGGNATMPTVVPTPTLLRLVRLGLLPIDNVHVVELLAARLSATCKWTTPTVATELSFLLPDGGAVDVVTSVQLLVSAYARGTAECCAEHDDNRRLGAAVGTLNAAVFRLLTDDLLAPPHSTHVVRVELTAAEGGRAHKRHRRLEYQRLLVLASIQASWSSAPTTGGVVGVAQLSFFFRRTLDSALTASSSIPPAVETHPTSAIAATVLSNVVLLWSSQCRSVGHILNDAAAAFIELESDLMALISRASSAAQWTLHQQILLQSKQQKDGKADRSYKAHGPHGLGSVTAFATVSALVAPLRALDALFGGRLLSLPGAPLCIHSGALLRFLIPVLLKWSTSCTTGVTAGDNTARLTGSLSNNDADAFLNAMSPLVDDLSFLTNVLRPSHYMSDAVAAPSLSPSVVAKCDQVREQMQALCVLVMHSDAAVGGNLGGTATLKWLRCIAGAFQSAVSLQTQTMLLRDLPSDAKLTSHINRGTVAAQGPSPLFDARSRVALHGAVLLLCTFVVPQRELAGLSPILEIRELVPLLESLLQLAAEHVRVVFQDSDLMVIAATLQLLCRNATAELSQGECSAAFATHLLDSLNCCVVHVMALRRESVGRTDTRLASSSLIEHTSSVAGGSALRFSGCLREDEAMWRGVVTELHSQLYLLSVASRSSHKPDAGLGAEACNE